jgi:hypothetical protein
MENHSPAMDIERINGIEDSTKGGTEKKKKRVSFAPPFVANEDVCPSLCVHRPQIQKERIFRLLDEVTFKPQAHLLTELAFQRAKRERVRRKRRRMEALFAYQQAEEERQVRSIFDYQQETSVDKHLACILASALGALVLLTVVVFVIKG